MKITPKLAQIVKAAVAMSAAGIIALVAMDSSSTKAHAQGRQDSDQYLAEIGLSIAPGFLNMSGKDLTLVGLGSYFVNGPAGCNGCHGSDPANEFLPKNNPFFLAPNNGPLAYNQATYMNGGQNFGPVGPGIVKDVNSPLYAGPGLGPNIITRNLTPDYTGLPEGGNDLAKFINIIRTGHDFDQLHLNCSATVTDNCYFGLGIPDATGLSSTPNPAPVNGAVLQVMPWPEFKSMTDYQLTAIWTYMTTIPCNAHNDALGEQFPWLTNVCTAGATGSTDATAAAAHGTAPSVRRSFGATRSSGSTNASNPGN